MLYNEFIKAGITLEEIELMERYAALAGLELGEYNGELCFIDSETGEAQFTSLNRMIKVMKIINIELMEINKNKAENMELLKFASKLMLMMESKACYENIA